MYLFICNQTLIVFGTPPSRGFFLLPPSSCQLMLDHPLPWMLSLPCSGEALLHMQAPHDPHQAVSSQHGCPYHTVKALSPHLFGLQCPGHPSSMGSLFIPHSPWHLLWSTMAFPLPSVEAHVLFLAWAFRTELFRKEEEDKKGEVEELFLSVSVCFLFFIFFLVMVAEDIF